MSVVHDVVLLFCSADRQDSRSHSSRRSSPESERQTRSRAGSYDSRERDQFERDRRDQRQVPNQPPPMQQRDWEHEAREWCNRGREPLLPRPDREPIRERDLRDLRALRDRERLLPNALHSHERDRERERERGDRERMVPFDLPPLGEPKGRLERADYEAREAITNVDKPGSAEEPLVQMDSCEMEKIDSLDGEWNLATF